MFFFLFVFVLFLFLFLFLLGSDDCDRDKFYTSVGQRIDSYPQDTRFSLNPRSAFVLHEVSVGRGRFCTSFLTLVIIHLVCFRKLERAKSHKSNGHMCYSASLSENVKSS